MRTRTLPSGKFLRFDVEKHAYSVHSSLSGDCVGITCSSVSGILDKCFPFDSHAVASRVALKLPPSIPIVDPLSGSHVLDAEGKILLRRPNAEEVQSEWSSRAALGSNIHAFIEQKILRSLTPLTPEAHEDKQKALKGLSPRLECNGEEHLYYAAADEASSLVLNDYEPVEVELMIASPDLKLAGTIDFLGRNKKTGGLLVGDWKTSSSQFSEFRHFSFDTPAGKDTLPFLVNEKQRRYALQTLIYGYLLRREGYLELYQQPAAVCLHNAALSRAASFNKSKRKALSRQATTEMITHLPLEYGIVQLSKQIDGSVGYQFKKVTPDDIVPVDMRDEVTPDDVIRSLIGE